MPRSTSCVCVASRRTHAGSRMFYTMGLEHTGHHHSVLRTQLTGALGKTCVLSCGVCLQEMMRPRPLTSRKTPRRSKSRLKILRRASERARLFSLSLSRVALGSVTLSLADSHASLRAQNTGHHLWGQGIVPILGDAVGTAKRGPPRRLLFRIKKKINFFSRLGALEPYWKPFKTRAGGCRSL